MSSSRVVTVALAAVLSLTLVACVGDDEPEASSPAPSAPASTAPSASATPDEEHAHGDEATPAAESSADAALATASEIMALYARPDVDASAWFADLQPFLSERAGTAYVYVDPANIEPTAIAGDARFETEPNEFYAVVLVPMDSGDWRLELERRDAADAWLADRIEPVE